MWRKIKLFEKMLKKCNVCGKNKWPWKCIFKCNGKLTQNHFFFLVIINQIKTVIFELHYWIHRIDVFFGLGKYDQSFYENINFSCTITIIESSDVFWRYNKFYHSARKLIKRRKILMGICHVLEIVSRFLYQHVDICRYYKVIFRKYWSVYKYYFYKKCSFWKWYQKSLSIRTELVRLT